MAVVIKDHVTVAVRVKIMSSLSPFRGEITNLHMSQNSAFPSGPIE